jgi:hypothetical protein
VRPLAIIAAVAGAAFVLSVSAFSDAAGGTACSLRAARAAIGSSNLPAPVKEDASARYSGIDRLICRDLTGDGRNDMVATVHSGGTAGVEAWVAFKRVGRGWKLVFRRLGHKVLIRSVPVGIVEIAPVYMDGDPNCCPSGGFDHTLFKWKSGRFAVARSWHSKKP